MTDVFGFFHPDGWFMHMQTGESWNTIMHAKAHGAYNLDKASRGIDTLEHFVLWSSLVAAFGNEGKCSACGAYARLVLQVSPCMAYLTVAHMTHL